MTICNMSIEGGARAGLIAPDDTTFEYLARPAARPAGRRLGRRGRALAALPTDDGATYDKTITIDADALEPMVTYGTNPGMGIPITSPRPVARPTQADPGQRRALERALEYMDLQPGQPILGQKVDVVFVGIVHERPDQRPAARRRASSRTATSPTACALMVVPGSRRGEARGRARGPGRDLQGRRRRVARGRLLDVHRDERRPAVARPVRGQHAATATSRAARARAAGRSSPRR